MTLSPFYPELDAAIRRYVQAATQHYLEQYQDQKFYALALGMVEDICGFFIVGNTLEQLANGCSEEDEAYQYWYISEWCSNEFEGLPNLVHDVVTHIAKNTDHDAEDFCLRQAYQNHILAVLADLRAQGQLRNAQGEELLVWVQYADASDENFDDISFAHLNSPELTELFIQRFNSEQDNLTGHLRQQMQKLGYLN
ncbi:DUF4303 domain-containing protein [Acinetobacter sp. MB5]|uniref:DUF4303 domain-containing protein n=1 Tax=Acinetobacter sp. MB5 TaxID=2069438 RepID=UPI000DD0CCBB|nr:DUF4303 domain-containing protein [Acinetobacter sp. MB5]